MSLSRKPGVPKYDVVVKVRCIGCQAIKSVRAGEIAADDVPMCDRCFMPMVAMAVAAQKGK